MKAIDVRLVAARRPDLLGETLRSFSQQMLKNFQIKGAYVNIDPVFGDESDLRESLRLIRGYLPMAEIRTPAEPNFCRAVKENWGRTTAEYVVHLEDDWIMNASIDSMFLQIFKDRVIAQISFNTREKELGFGEGLKLSMTQRRVRIFGLKVFSYGAPIFTTSPSILLGEFARHAALLLDTSLDPEKQFYNRLNVNLERFVYQYRSLVYCLPDRYVITDIGRDWRDERGIRKIMNDGVSTWTSISGDE